MTDDEILGTVAALRVMTLEHGLGWVVEQVDDQLRDGNTVGLTEPVRVKLPGNERQTQIKSGSRTIPFTPLEQMEILASAIRRAVVLPALLQEGIAATLRELASPRDDQHPSTQTSASAGNGEPKGAVGPGSPVPQDLRLLVVGEPADEMIQIGTLSLAGARQLEEALEGLLAEARR